jgi:hypothetical protein
MKPALPAVSRHWRQLLVLAAAVALGGACASSEVTPTPEASAPPSATASPEPTTSPTTAATAEPKTPEPEAGTPTPDAPSATPLSTPTLAEVNARRTGDPQIDSVIDALFGRERDARAAVDALVRTQSAVCHEDSRGIGDLEVCPAGVAEGTDVEFFPTGVCEGFPLHNPPFVSLFLPDRTRLVSVIAVEPRAEPIPLWPDGEHLIILEGVADPRNVTGVYIEDGQIVRTQQGCTAVEFLLEVGGDSPEDLLPAID